MESCNLAWHFHLTFIYWYPISFQASLVAQMVKHLPAMRKTRVQFLGQEDPLEKEMATHSSTLAWKIPWTEESDRLQSTGSQRVGLDWATSLLLMGRALFPPCCLTWGQTMVEVMKIMVTSFKRSHACTATLSAPHPSEANPCLCWRLGHFGQVWISLLVYHSSIK